MFDAHKYKCPDCGIFIVKNDTEGEYDKNPSERYCLLCGGHTGKIGYAGAVGFMMKPIQDGFCEGVFNPADGKTYDSRSAYYKAVKDKGLEIVGDDKSFQERRSPATKEIDWKQAVGETIKQLR